MGLGQLPWKDIVTIAAAFVGATLGIMNMWNTINQRRVRLKVTPLSTFSGANPGANINEGFAIEIINLSSFAVTIREIGFTLNGNKTASKWGRFVVTKPIFMDNGVWPRRLEARQAVTGYFEKPTTNESRVRFGRAYAMTSCGEIRYGTSEVLENLKLQLA